MHNPPQHQPAPSRGFTLVELLVALTILVAIAATVYESFVSVVDTAELARENANKVRYEQYLRRHLLQHLSCVYADSGAEVSEYQFLGEDKDGAFGGADILSFCTSLPMDAPTALPGILKVVTYELDKAEKDVEEGAGGSLEDKDAPPEAQDLVLRITEEPLVLTGEFDEPLEALEDMVVERQVPVMSFDVEYYDAKKEEWVKEWDSLNELRLPWAVRVRINFARTKEEMQGEAQLGINLAEDPDLDMTIPIPFGAGVEEQWRDFNHLGPTAGMEEGEDDVFED